MNAQLSAKIRALMSLQPIHDIDAEKLDTIISKRVHQIFGQLFIGNKQRGSYTSGTTRRTRIQQHKENEPRDCGRRTKKGP